MSDPILDKLLIELKIIAQIPENGRLNTTSSGYLEIEPSTGSNPWINLEWVWRALRFDSREKTKNRIYSIISEAVTWSNTIMGASTTPILSTDNENQREYDIQVRNCKNLARLSTEFKQAIRGLSNLKITYNTHPTTLSRLDLYIETITIQTDAIDRYLAKYNTRDASHRASRS